MNFFTDIQNFNIFGNIISLINLNIFKEMILNSFWNTYSYSSDVAWFYLSVIFEKLKDFCVVLAINISLFVLNLSWVFIKIIFYWLTYIITMIMNNTIAMSVITFILFLQFIRLKTSELIKKWFGLVIKNVKDDSNVNSSGSIYTRYANNLPNKKNGNNKKDEKHHPKKDEKGSFHRNGNRFEVRANNIGCLKNTLFKLNKALRGLNISEIEIHVNVKDSSHISEVKKCMRNGIPKGISIDYNRMKFKS